MEVFLVTSNPGKASEAKAILEGSGLEIRMLPMWLGEVETGTTYEENARLKVTAGFRMLRAPVLAEDAGLEVDALEGLPGLHSARFAGPSATSADNNAKVLRLLEGVSSDGRSARYQAVAVLLLPSGEEIIGRGTLEGQIESAPRGGGGFGYDPLFVPRGKDRTVAQLSTSEKNEISHRAQALREIVTRTAER